MRRLAVVALLAAGLPSAGAAGAKAGLPFVHDDYARALAEARTRKVPLLVEVWAPW